MESSVLPESWAAVTLEAVADVHDNLREPVNSTERKGRVGPFPYYGATGQVGWIDDFRQDGEYVLLGEDGAPFFDPTKDKAYLVSGKCWVNNHAHVLKGRDGVCLDRYLLYALNQVNYRGFANGTTRLKLTQAAMRQLPINLAPLAEQHRIVAKIEELFSELDQGVASLKTAREQLKVYRQSLLKNAFEGKLTAAWRAAHRDQLETAAALQQRIAREREARYQQQLADWQANGKQGPKPKAPKPLPPLTAEELAELPELPEGWGWVKAGEICDSIVPNRDKPKSFSGDIPWITTPCLRSTSIRICYEKSDSGLTPEEASRFGAKVIPTNSVVMTCVGTFGLGAVVETPVVINQQLHAFLSTPLIDPRFLAYRVQAGLSYFEKSSTSTTIQYLNKEKCNSFPTPICCLEEQRYVVQELESRLSEADQLELTLATALQQADALRQSILKKAFCGQLVNQAKHDEPATALLERIRAARLPASSKKKTLSTAGATQ